MKIPRPGLLARIVIAIAAGIALGAVAPLWLSRVMATFCQVFASFLGFMIPLIIVGFVTPAIADIGARAGRMLVVTALLAYGATILAGVMSYLIGSASFPGLIAGYPALQDVEASASLEPYFTLQLNPLCDVMTALVLAFLLGLGIAAVKGGTLHRCATELREIVEMAIRKAVIPLLPWYILGIFMEMTATGRVGPILSTFLAIILIIFGIHVLDLLLLYCVAGAAARRNPLRMLWTMMPAYFTALGTQSSAATIPVTLKRTMMLGVKPDVASFTVPLCATIHLSGSTLKIVACALALMILHGMPHTLGLFVNFIAMLGITMLAAPGIPGGAIMASLGLLQSILGFDAQQTAMMIALYIAMDSFGTACNVTGDGALSVIVDRIFRNSKPDPDIA